MEYIGAGVLTVTQVHLVPTMLPTKHEGAISGAHAGAVVALYLWSRSQRFEPWPLHCLDGSADGRLSGKSRKTMIEKLPEIARCGEKGPAKSGEVAGSVRQGWWPPKPTWWISLPQTFCPLARPALPPPAVPRVQYFRNFSIAAFCFFRIPVVSLRGK